MDDLDLVSKLSDEERILLEHRMKNISPDDAKYGDSSAKLADYLSYEAEWMGCAFVQLKLLEWRKEYGEAEEKNVREVEDAISKISSLNMMLLEDKIHHDQLAVIEEIGRFVSPETKSLLHPGTTSYDILDTARSYLYQGAWFNVIKNQTTEVVDKLCDLAEKSMDIIQTGRTHLQDTSPVTFGHMLSIYARRLSDRISKMDDAFTELKGKISGMVGTGAGIEMVIGKGTSITFEKNVLEELELQPDYTATQIVQKEALADVGHAITTTMLVLGDFTNDIRLLYSSAIQEVTTRDNADRLGGSSTDAMKNNPINYENIAGTAPVVMAGMIPLYSLIQSDLQRDLRGSKTARYQPQQMMVELYESFARTSKVLDKLSINEDKIAENLQKVRDNPSEAMVTILRGEKWIHSEYGVGHDFVKEMGKKAKREKRKLINVCLSDDKFLRMFKNLPQNKKDILNGEMEKYTGSAKKRAKMNIDYSRDTIRRL